ncbi:hypothetical protein D3C86_2200250 [compost metagenome]
MVDILVVQRQVADLDDLQFQRGRRQFGQSQGQLAVDRALAQAADQNGDVVDLAHDDSLPVRAGSGVN